MVDSARLTCLGEVVNNGGFTATLKVPFGDATRIAAVLLATLPVQDFTVEEVPLEEVLSQIFTSGPGEVAGGA